MDMFLRALGFDIGRYRQLSENIKREVMELPDKRVILGCGSEGAYVEYYKMYGENIGVMLRGFLDENEEITTPVYEAYAVSDDDITVNKYILEYVNDEPVVVFEDFGTGNELVFSLQDRVELLRDERGFIDYGRSVYYSKERGIVNRKVNYAALSLYGNIILPIYKDGSEESDIYEEESFYKDLVFRYREGDDEAGDILSAYAEETSRQIQERLEEEDFLSIVEGYFMPFDESETDYLVLGEITDVSAVKNIKTQKEVIKLKLSVTGTYIQLFINRSDLTGFPMVGMRFMGICRLQGSVVFE